MGADRETILDLRGATSDGKPEIVVVEGGNRKSTQIDIIGDRHG